MVIGVVVGFSCCTTTFVHKSLTIDCDLVGVALHEVVVGKLFTRSVVIEAKSTVTSHGFANTLRVDLPVSFAFVLVVVEHPLRRGELRHDHDLEVVDGNAGEIQRHHWEKGH